MLNIISSAFYMYGWWICHFCSALNLFWKCHCHPFQVHSFYFPIGVTQFLPLFCDCMLHPPFRCCLYCSFAFHFLCVVAHEILKGVKYIWIFIDCQDFLLQLYSQFSPSHNKYNDVKNKKKRKEKKKICLKKM